MRVILINTSSKKGGAAIACRRLLKALNKNGTPTTMLVRDEAIAENMISTTHSKFKKWLNFYRFAYERFLFFIREKSKAVRFLFSIANVGEGIHKRKEIKQADIVHFHWINEGFISITGIRKIFKQKKPVVWTLHDMWSFTGGCHHSGECNRFKESCGECPFLKRPSAHDLSYRILQKKKKAFAQANLTVVTCSQWLAGKARESALFASINVVSIPNPIDTNVFKPLNKSEARKSFGLDENKKYLLFGAVNVKNYFKGFTFFRDALKVLIESNPELSSQLEIVILGRSDEEILREVPFTCNVIGSINEESKMCQLYNAVDWFVTSSLQENLPNTIMESFACGTPVVAFNVGGIPEMVEHKQNGYLATYKSIDDLSNGIRWAIYEANHSQLSENARKKVLDCYSEDVVAEKYNNLYKSLL